MGISTEFFSLIIKRFFRSSSFVTDITVQIILGIIAIAVVGYCLLLAFALEKQIISAFKQSNVVAFLNGLLFYYFIAEFVIRYLIQSLPSLGVQPLLHLPIKRSKIINFFLGLSLIQLPNIFVFLLFGQFAFGAVAHQVGIQQASIWLVSLWFVSLILHYVVILMKLTSHKMEWKLFFVILAGCAIAGADYFGLVKLSLAAEKFFNAILQGYAVTGVLFLMTILGHYITYQVILRSFYPEELEIRENHFSPITNFSFLRKFGHTGMWMSIELKMIFRNKRTREVFFMSTMVFFQQLILCYVLKEHDFGIFLFLGIACTGLFIGNYGQYAFSWQGGHFDFTLTQPTSLRSYVQAKCLLFALMTAAWFLFTTPFVYFGWDILFINLASTLYNLSVNMFVVMNMSMSHTTKLNLKRGGALNYEGAGAAQWLIGIPFLVGPLVIYLPFNLMGYKTLGVAAVGLVGLIGIILNKSLINFTYKRFLDRRYTIASSFRKQ